MAYPSNSEPLDSPQQLTRAVNPDGSPLTTYQRRRKTWKLFCEGRSSKEIADLLGVTSRTVSNDIKEIRVIHKQNLDAANAEEYASLMLARLETLYNIAMEYINNPLTPARTKAQFMDRAQSVLDRLSKFSAKTPDLAPTSPLVFSFAPLPPSPEPAKESDNGS